MTSRKLIIFLLLLSAVILAALHNAAISLNWYYLYPLMDIPIHILGGFTIALLSYIVLSAGHLPAEANSVAFQLSTYNLSIIIFATFLISIVWEVLELVLFLTKDAGLSAETLSDIIFGVVGAVLAAGLLRLLPDRYLR